jgi:hypothetical protein
MKASKAIVKILRRLEALEEKVDAIGETVAEIHEAMVDGNAKPEPEKVTTPKKAKAAKSE